jgi:hypothetical protein
MPIPAYEQMLRPLLVLASTGDLTRQQGTVAMADQFQLSPDRRSACACAATHPSQGLLTSVVIDSIEDWWMEDLSWEAPDHPRWNSWIRVSPVQFEGENRRIPRGVRLCSAAARAGDPVQIIEWSILHVDEAQSPYLRHGPSPRRVTAARRRSAPTRSRYAFSVTATRITSPP